MQAFKTSVARRQGIFLVVGTTKHLLAANLAQHSATTVTIIVALVTLIACLYLAAVTGFAILAQLYHSLLLTLPIVWIFRLPTACHEASGVDDDIALGVLELNHDRWHCQVIVLLILLLLVLLDGEVVRDVVVVLIHTLFPRAHALLDRALHANQTDAELVLQQLSD